MITTGRDCAVLSGDTKLSDTSDGEREPPGPSQEASPVPSMEDIPLEQSRDDTFCFAFNQVIKLMVCLLSVPLRSADIPTPFID